MAKPITVWVFDDAPKKLQALSTNGGDEDWLAEIPPELAHQYIGWMEEGSSFGCCCVDSFKHPTKRNWEIRIGCHG